MLELHHFHLSAASYRVRIALEFKGVPWQSRPVSLIRGGGEQFTLDYRTLNPQALLPTLCEGDFVLTQSLAILEYLEETHPAPSYLPKDPRQRARARQFAALVVADIQSLTALRVIAWLRTNLPTDEVARSQWVRHWLVEGMDALELWLTAENSGGRYCVGEEISIADLCLVPLMHAARRFQLQVEDFPRLCAIEEACLEHPAFARAHPDRHAEG